MRFKYNKKEVYKDTYYIKQYDDNYFRIVHCKSLRQKGFEAPKKVKTSEENIIAVEEIERISLSRTKRSIREIAFCNPFTYFATFTVNSDVCDRYALAECQRDLKKLLKAYKRKNPKFIYIIITEKHKDGAYHFHGLIGGIKLGFTEKDDLYINENGYISSKHFDKLGFNSFSRIKHFYKACNYMLKYITKSCCRNDTNQIYFCSRGLKRPDKYEIPAIDIDWQYENDFVQIKDSYNLTKEEILEIYNRRLDREKKYKYNTN